VLLTFPKDRGGIAGRRIREIRVIERIEEFGAEFEAHFLRELETLEQAQIDVAIAGAVESLGAADRRSGGGW